MRTRTAVMQIGGDNLFFAVRSARIGGGQCGRARLAIPGNETVFGGRRNAQRPN